MVFLKNLEGQTLTLNVTPLSKVSELKQQVQLLESIAEEEQRLLFAGELKL